VARGARFGAGRGSARSGLTLASGAYGFLDAFKNGMRPWETRLPMLRIACFAGLELALMFVTRVIPV
jgi:hypothetical protein